jgi:hypothetical protein
MSKTDNERHGTFSSSSAWKLMTKDKSGKDFGTQGKKYIKQVGYELKLGRAVDKETNAKATSWGEFIEGRVFDLLPLEYRLVSKERLFHPQIKHYSGAPDLVKICTGADVKCPFSLEVFCDKIEALKSLQTYKEEFPEDYWQHISNSILLEANGIKITHFEAIIYVPYKSELAEIREMAFNYRGDQNKIAWINWANDEDLPFLVDGGYYKNLNIVRYEVPQEDKELLTERIKQACKLLPNNEPFVMVAEYIENDQLTIIK